MKRIAHYTITRDGQPTRIAESFKRFPYSILGDVLLPVKKGEEPTMFYTCNEALEAERARTFRRNAYRRAKRAIIRTIDKAVEFDASCHYDSKS